MVDVDKLIMKNRLAYKHKLTQASPEVAKIKERIEKNDLDFGSNAYQRHDGRLITQFEDLSAENVVVLHLKNELRKKFRLNFTNRNKIIEELFDRLQVASSLQDFSIIRFDFKNYFYSISSEYINEKFLNNSGLSRKDKNYINSLCEANPYCVAGLSIFNYFVEIISRDFDRMLRTQLSEHGLVYYERYVDDGIIILNKYLAKKDIKKIIDNTINNVFQNADSKNKVKLNSEKFIVINRRHLESGRHPFDFLGYKFSIIDNFKRLEIGISDAKILKYQSKINKLLKNSFVAGNKISEEKTRHMIKAHSSRVVYCSLSASKHNLWISKGIIATYNKLKDYPTSLDSKTKKFLKNIYADAFASIGENSPNYLSTDRYNLYENLLKNKAIIFNEMIGMPKEVLLIKLEAIGNHTKNSTYPYDYILREYLIGIKIGY